MWVMTLLLGLSALPVNAAGPTTAGPIPSGLLSDAVVDANSGATSSLLGSLNQNMNAAFAYSELQLLKKGWPDDLHRYSDQFCQLRDLCAQAAKNYWNDKAKDSKSPQLHPISTRGQEAYRKSMRQKLPAYMNKRLEELDGAVAMEFQLNHCPIMDSIAHFWQVGASKYFKDAVNKLQIDVDNHRYTACREEIDAWIGDRCIQLRAEKTKEGRDAKAKSANSIREKIVKKKKIKREIARQGVQQ